jgi:hypothetical protein
MNTTPAPRTATTASSGGDTPHRTPPRLLGSVVVFIAMVVAVVGSLGAPLITAVAEHYRVSLAAAQ